VPYAARADGFALSRPTGLSTREAQAFQPPRCAQCGSPTQLRWIDISTTPDAEPRWQLDRVRCLTPGCRANADDTANASGSANRR